MNVTYHMDEDDKGNQMDEEKHDMDENWYREQEKYIQLGFLFCALNAGAGTARRWRSPRSNWESEGERRRTLSHAESTEREREIMVRCALPGIAGTRQKKENKLVERGFGGTGTTSTAAAECERLKEVLNV